MVNIYICDDDSNELNKFEKCMSKIIKEIDVVCKIEQFASGIQLLNAINISEEKPDIIYMDIHMPNMNGLEVAEELRKMKLDIEIIFRSKSKPEVFKAFDVDAFHYIVKDETTESRQKEIFLKAYKGVQKKREVYLSISRLGRNETYPLREIEYFQVNRNIIEIYLRNKTSVDFYSTINKLEDSLLNKGFLRISRNTIVNMNYVSSHSPNDVVMKSKTDLPIGRVYKKKANQMLEAFLKRKEILKV